MIYVVKKFVLIKLLINIFFLLTYFLKNLIEFNKIENYFKFCTNAMHSKLRRFLKNKFPKISIISPVYNREKYILRFITSIQNQIFQDIEIIFIDDCSSDNSFKIIKELQKEDERILIIKHRKNKGTFISRNEGVLYSSGQYIILPDPDDILSQNILKICYNIVKRYNYEMIRFNIYIGNSNIFANDIIKGLKEKPIYQPQLSTYLFYGKGKLFQIDFNVSNKFIKSLYLLYIKKFSILHKKIQA